MRQMMWPGNKELGVVNFRITKEAREQLDALCKATHRSQGLMIAHLVEQEFKRTMVPAEQGPETVAEDVERRR